MLTVILSFADNCVPCLWHDKTISTGSPVYFCGDIEMSYLKLKYCMYSR